MSKIENLASLLRTSQHDATMLEHSIIFDAESEYKALLVFAQEVSVGAYKPEELQAAAKQAMGTPDAGRDRYKALAGKLADIVIQCQIMGFLQPNPDASPTHRQLVTDAVAALAEYDSSLKGQQEMGK